MLLNMHDHYKIINDYNIDLIYNGPIWPEGIEGFAETLKRKMTLERLTLPVSQSIFSVFIEQVNNISLYSEEKSHLEAAENNGRFVSQGMFVVGISNNKYFLQSGNVIKSENVELIENRIKHINALDKKELRNYYKEQLKSKNFNKDSKGAGIGLIEIARRACSKIEYSFYPYGNGLAFFSMSVTIEK